MINAKKLYMKLLSDKRITSLISEDNILNSYPSTIENFPCIIFLDEFQSDTEYNDNKVGASYCSVEIHIFTKKLTGYISSSELAIVVSEVMNEDLWHCSQNGEVSDPSQDVEHRVLRFQKSIYNN